ncbi:carbon-nitrogen hydrolase [Rhodococcus rhodnii]|uniref:Nitrilase n=2 Tax=Rhodococcus rhodnii TaxID=38312 RepID=R7WM53_9NOCA|nr:nitrilase-related carbon-nitrogen hydrolase [Rhodococcus rhodnii]EOM75104.1 nitrilase [Rhodococcus rhodnii LMG 5362]TXG89365.1 carbon-nitrogen hydrolase [Rhodococcus rhodnii]
MTSRTLRIGLTQWHATTDVEANVATAVRCIERAAEGGAAVVALPENGLMLGTNSEMRAAASGVDGDPVRSLRDAARRFGVVVVLGGMKNTTDDGVFNSALVIDASGEIAGRYDKLHLFDANIGGQSFEASSVEKPGSELVVVDVDGVRLGLTICYDVRFPEVARALAVAGAEVILVPAAFVYATGEAHWHTLLRARAIENLAYVVAPATVRSADPEYTDGFTTYGHALAVGPWGSVLADLGDATEAVEVLELDMAEVEAARAKLPVLGGRRDPSVYASQPRVLSVASSRSVAGGSAKEGAA